jgi:hypothetical protein
MVLCKRAKETDRPDRLFGDHESLVGIVGVFDNLPLNPLTFASYHPDVRSCSVNKPSSGRDQDCRRIESPRASAKAFPVSITTN